MLGQATNEKYERVAIMASPQKSEREFSSCLQSTFWDLRQRHSKDWDGFQN
jgi:hypothetical protein